MNNKDSRIDEVFDSWPEWKKQFTITKYSAGNGYSVSATDAKERSSPSTRKSSAKPQPA